MARPLPTLLAFALACGAGFLVACSTGGGSLPGGSAPDGSVASGPDGGSTVEPTISSSEFDRSCTADDECVVVFMGSACNQCKCENDAIAKKDLERYRSTLATRSANCGEGRPCSADCAMPVAACKNSQCVATMKAPDAG